MPLSEKRKGDRAKMVTAIVAIASEFGLVCSVLNEGADVYKKRCTTVTITTERGLSCFFDFDGESCQPDVFVNAWHIGSQSDACLVDHFPGGDVNPFHYRKCTTVAYGFDALCAHIRNVLRMDQDRTLYSSEREATAVAKNGTWQERQANWQKIKFA